MTHPTASLLLLSVTAVSCGMAFTADESSLLSTPGKGIEGAWISTELQEQHDLSCPWIIEIFADGSIETNYISDDRGNQCMFARVPHQHEPDQDPPLLRIAGQLSTCIYKLDKTRLLLTCEDHGVPRVDDVRWIAFDPIEVKRGQKLADLAGEWLPPLFWGGKERMVIGAGGQLSFGDLTGNVRIVGKGKLLIEGGDHGEKCLFRVTARRLTMRCRPESDEWPAALFEPGDETATLETMVFYRL